MPYRPEIPFQPTGLAPGINTFGGAIEARGGIWGMIEADRKKKQEEQAKDATNQALFHYLSTSLDSNGNPLVGDEEKALFQAGNLRQRSGLIAGLLFRADQENQAADRGLKLKIATMRDTGDPNAGKPQPLTAPDGTVIPGKFYVPGANQIIDITPRASGAPPPDLVIPPGTFWNGRQLVQQRSQEQDDLAQLDALNRRNRSQAIDQQLVDAESEIAAGNVRPGPDWLPLTTPYAVRAKKLEAQRRQLLQPGGATAAPAPSPTPTGKVRVRHPNGQTGFIPAAQLQSALANGYEQIP